MTGRVLVSASPRPLDSMGAALRSKSLMPPKELPVDCLLYAGLSRLTDAELACWPLGCCASGSGGTASRDATSGGASRSETSDAVRSWSDAGAAPVTLAACSGANAADALVSAAVWPLQTPVLTSSASPASAADGRVSWRLSAGHTCISQSSADTYQP